MSFAFIAWRAGLLVAASEIEAPSGVDCIALGAEFLDRLMVEGRPCPEIIEAHEVGGLFQWNKSPRELVIEAAAAGSPCGHALAAELDSLEAWKVGA